MRQGSPWKSQLLAAAYCYQQQAKPYLELLATTEKSINPKPDEIWLDLGCGSGRLTKSIWERSEGRVGMVVGIDISRTGLLYAQRAARSFAPVPPPRRIQWMQADFNGTVARLFRDNSFDGITAGLSMCYADHWDEQSRKWDRKAYVQLMHDIYRVLKQGGSFIFSSCVPNPNFRQLALESWKDVFLTWKAPWHLLVSSVMLWHAGRVLDEVRRGRFHFPTLDQIINLLKGIGFSNIEYELTYASQAWVFRALK